MSMLVRKGTLVRPKTSRSIRRSLGYINPALSADVEKSGQVETIYTPANQLLKDYAEDSDDPDTGNYGTIFKELRDANSDSEGLFEFLCRTFSIISTSFLMTVILGFFMLLPLAMISVGGNHVSDCPVEPNLPLYLLIGGSLGFVKMALLIFYQLDARRRRNHGIVDYPDEGPPKDQVLSRCARFTDKLLSIFHFVWFIMGNFWLFTIWQPNFELPLYDPNNWCDRTVFFFTFYQILTIYSVISLVIVLTFCLGIFYLCDKSLFCCRR